ncbi:MAG: 16S rRNA (adenine(1518)-N(6)/adenine(1519)-N(6))-dimethyltransferase RsmA [Candidatus Omnitrophota bacterium]|nr:ribosomal RNA small subunit methyltransferase A [Candidatus Omnitrophota bacterium]
MKQSRSLGQVFLTDVRYIQRIVDHLPLDNALVLEIGPGLGALSERILTRTEFLYCVELDGRFAKALGKRFQHDSRLTVMNADIRSFDLSSLPRAPVIVGNIPYAISNDLMRYLVANRHFFSCAFLTVQREFADKLAARVSTKSFSYLSCYIQYYARVEKLFDIPARAFSPVPKVDSTFIKITFYRQVPHCASDESHLFTIVRAAFSQRRKKISNSLRSFIEDPTILKSLGIASCARAENISLSQYVALANALCA